MLCIELIDRRTYLLWLWTALPSTHKTIHWVDRLYLCTYWIRILEYAHFRLVLVILHLPWCLTPKTKMLLGVFWGLEAGFTPSGIWEFRIENWKRQKDNIYINEILTMQRWDLGNDSPLFDITEWEILGSKLHVDRLREKIVIPTQF